MDLGPTLALEWGLGLAAVGLAVGAIQLRDCSQQVVLGEFKLVGNDVPHRFTQQRQSVDPIVKVLILVTLCLPLMPDFL